MREEFRGLAEGEKNAAVMAVAETLGRADLIDVNDAGRVIVAASLDAATLERSVRRHIQGSTKYLSAEGTAFYDLVLSQCCASIVEIADKLPSFQSDAFAMLLGNDRTILERIEEVLTRLPMPSKEATGGDQVEVDYRRVIAKDFDRLQLFGLDFAAQWYPLSVAYVSLTMAARQSLPAGSGGRGGTGPGDRTFEYWLDACPRLLIEGRAGGGKTTLLQWISVRAALRDFTGAAAAYNEHIPFYLRLRGYVGRTLPTPGEFLDSTASALTPEAGMWPSQRLREGKAFVLVDGLDEIPERQRPAVLGWLEQLTGAFPQARYVVTTRPGAVESDALAREGFVTADLEPMSPSLVRVFVNRWHDAMRGFQQDTAAVERLTECHARLLRTLDNDRFLGELANTPLLAGLICALNQYLDGELPRRRGEIYAEALKMFHKRDRKREIASDVSLDLDATNHLLSDLALWMVRNARTEVASVDADTDPESLVTADSARIVLSQSALSLPSRPPTDLDLYRHLLLRSAVLREPTAGRVDFVHRTFQEYLAAKALIRTDSVNELIKNADDDQWREIVILASGLGITRQTSELLRGLLKQGWLGRQRYSRRLLAVACLDEIRDADPGVLGQVADAIPELLPPKDMTQAEALSHAGDRLVPHVARGLIGYSKSVYPPVIRAAALTGGPEALSLIAELTSIIDLPAMRQAIVNSSPERYDSFAMLYSSFVEELLRAWSYFDAENYAERVIAVTGFGRVTVTDARVLKGLNKAPGVESVRLEGLVAGDIDPSILNNANISEVIISHCGFTTLASIIGNWSAVSRLALHSCPNLESIGELWRLVNLTELEIVSCGRISELLTEGIVVSGSDIVFFGGNGRLVEFSRFNLGLTILRLGYANVDRTVEPGLWPTMTIPGESRRTSLGRPDDLVVTLIPDTIDTTGTDSLSAFS
jgi:hypothetical protein